MMRSRPWVVFALVFAWKVALFALTAQPVPANDAYFYDGAVIHKLLHGGYYNPCLAWAFPISGKEIFSSYPPGYQFSLFIWMSIFGVSALSAMAFHLVLFGLYLLVLLAIFRRLQFPAWCVNVSGALLLTFTFHDRPDSVAHVLGILAVYSCVRSRRILGGGGVGASGKWVWLMVVLIVLAVCTSLQIGGIYFLVVVMATLAACSLGKERVPAIALSLMIFIPLVLILSVSLLLPRAWAGFMEHMHQTPTITGWRAPHWQELAKIVRTVPGIILVTILLPISWFKQHGDFKSDSGLREEVILVATLLPALGVMAASLFFLSPNTVAIANYLQPVIVAGYLALSAELGLTRRWFRLQLWCFAPAILLGSVRAVGMTTWGVQCAADVSYAASVQRVHAELASQPAGEKIVMSSALLYAASEHSELALIHCDWMTRANGDSRITDVAALLALKPRKMILTQYDYYRRFQAVIERVKVEPSLTGVEVLDTAKTPPPDSFKSLQQVVQHISWAPVIVNFSWRDGQ